MNPLLILTRNNLELTKKCVESVRRQDCGEIAIDILDNDSTDSTYRWAKHNADILTSYSPQIGVSAGWNTELKHLFENEGAEHVLVLNNDTILPPWFYRTLLSYEELFVTGVAVDRLPTEHPIPTPLSPNPDFSAFLIRREAWEKIGPFDERMKIYCSDCDYHIRAHRLGVPLWKANVPYYHVNSQTIKRAEPGERAIIEAQANKDREIFQSIYGCLPGTREYEELFKEGR